MNQIETEITRGGEACPRRPGNGLVVDPAIAVTSRSNVLSLDTKVFG